MIEVNKPWIIPSLHLLLRCGLITFGKMSKQLRLLQEIVQSPLPPIVLQTKQTSINLPTQYTINNNKKTATTPQYVATHHISFNRSVLLIKYFLNLLFLHFLHLFESGLFALANFSIGQIISILLYEYQITHGTLNNATLPKLKFTLYSNFRLI